MVGGAPGGPGSTVDRIDYSNDTASYAAMSNLPNAYMKLTATSAQDNGQPAATPSTPIVPATRTESGGTTPVGTDFGYINGSNWGSSPSYVSTVDRIDYSKRHCNSTCKRTIKH